ncbi:hypothetical protein AGMMS50276_12570 [Synergistales bacterium]|nr:hypothetical protein AGMMS50276_12570 [Synergistales bacterium]
MKEDERNRSLLKHIVRYCDEINDTIINHSLTLEKVKSDVVFKNSLAMNVLQIGELVSALSEDFKTVRNI